MFEPQFRNFPPFQETPVNYLRITFISYNDDTLPFDQGIMPVLTSVRANCMNLLRRDRGFVEQRYGYTNVPVNADRNKERLSPVLTLPLYSLHLEVNPKKRFLVFEVMQDVLTVECVLPLFDDNGHCLLGRGSYEAHFMENQHGTSINPTPRIWFLLQYETENVVSKFSFLSLKPPIRIIRAVCRCPPGFAEIMVSEPVPNFIISPPYSLQEETGSRSSQSSIQTGTRQRQRDCQRYQIRREIEDMTITPASQQSLVNIDQGTSDITQVHHWPSETSHNSVTIRDSAGMTVTPALKPAKSLFKKGPGNTPGSNNIQSLGDIGQDTSDIIETHQWPDDMLHSSVTIRDRTKRTFAPAFKPANSLIKMGPVNTFGPSDIQSLVNMGQGTSDITQVHHWPSETSHNSVTIRDSAGMTVTPLKPAKSLFKMGPGNTPGSNNIQSLVDICQDTSDIGQGTSGITKSHQWPGETSRSSVTIRDSAGMTVTPAYKPEKSLIKIGPSNTTCKNIIQRGQISQNYINRKDITPLTVIPVFEPQPPINLGRANRSNIHERVGNSVKRDRTGKVILPIYEPRAPIINTGSGITPDISHFQERPFQNTSDGPRGTVLSQLQRSLLKKRSIGSSHANESQGEMSNSSVNKIDSTGMPVFMTRNDLLEAARDNTSGLSLFQKNKDEES